MAEGGSQMSPEQVEEMQEKIKNMSHEELREFQKQQCIFCHIISGKVQSRKIYEDENVLAILDINPANPGHVLVLPKEHYAIMPQLSNEEISHVFMIVKTISNACLRALGVTGTNIIVQNGVAAGQKAQHFMVHVIPCQDGDGLRFEVPQRQMKEDDLEKVRKQIATHMGKKSEDSGLQAASKKYVKVEKPAAKVQEPPEIVFPREKELPSQPVEVAESETVEDPDEEVEDLEEDSGDDEDDDRGRGGVNLDDISKILGNG
ncbi:MAG: HIT family protein [Nanoarchaeota archaeon]|nr:HIT family protein [Nanoarchaeota archaeon]